MDHSLAPPIKKQTTIYQKLITSINTMKDLVGKDEEKTQSIDDIKEPSNSIISIESQANQSISSEETITHTDDVNESIELSKSLASINYFSSISFLENMDRSQASATENKSGTQTLSQLVDDQATKSAETIKNSIAFIDDEYSDFINGRRVSTNDDKPKRWSTGTIVLVILSIIALFAGTKALIENYNQGLASKNNTKLTTQDSVKEDLPAINVLDDYSSNELTKDKEDVKEEEKKEEENTTIIPQPGEKYTIEFQYAEQTISTVFTLGSGGSIFRYNGKIENYQPKYESQYLTLSITVIKDFDSFCVQIFNETDTQLDKIDPLYLNQTSKDSKKIKKVTIRKT